MSREASASIQPVLDRLGIPADALLGEGGEARVYALDRDRVARVHRPGTSARAVEVRRDLLTELARDADRVPFATPKVLETFEVDRVWVSLEPRLPGNSLRLVLDELTGVRRERVLVRYLEAAATIGRLRVSRPWQGDLCRPDAVRCESFSDYLREQATASLAAAGGPGAADPRPFANVDGVSIARSLVDALPGATPPSVVHLDAFPGNMLSDGERITAVLDFGTVTLRGDRRLDPLAAAVYLEPPMTPSADSSDRALARRWLTEQGLGDALGPARLWLAAFWARAPADSALHRWCREVLLDAT